MPSLETLTAEHFEPHLGGSYGLEAAGTALALRLASVRKGGQGHRDGGAFSLLFVADPGPFLPQAIYTLHDPAGVALEIFLVPIGPVEGGNGYEAVFA